MSNTNLKDSAVPGHVAEAPHDGHGEPGADPATSRKHHAIRVTVRFAAAVHPLVEEHVARNETLAVLKARALKAFKLEEGPLPDGNVATYKLFHGKEELTDLNRTVGDLAGHRDELDLKLSQFITQGCP